jgi:hypothetical protein
LESEELLDKAIGWRHPNGFLKIVVRSDETLDPKVRLHIWNGADVHGVDIHNHFWSFSSLILCGFLVNETFRQTVDPDVALRTVQYRLNRREGGNHLLESQGVSGVALVSRNKMGPGDVYGLNFRQLHRVIPDGRGITATMVLQGPAMTDDNTILRSIANATTPGYVSVERLNRAELTLALERLQTAIAF